MRQRLRYSAAMVGASTVAGRLLHSRSTLLPDSVGSSSSISMHRHAVQARACPRSACSVMAHSRTRPVSLPCAALHWPRSPTFGWRPCSRTMKLAPVSCQPCSRPLVQKWLSATHSSPGREPSTSGITPTRSLSYSSSHATRSRTSASSGSYTTSECPGSAAPRLPLSTPSLFSLRARWLPSTTLSLHPARLLGLSRLSITGPSLLALPCTNALSNSGCVPLTFSYSAATDTGRLLLCLAAACSDGLSPSVTSVISSTTVDNISLRAYCCPRCASNTSSIHFAGSASSSTMRAITLAGVCCSNLSITASQISFSCGFFIPPAYWLPGGHLERDGIEKASQRGNQGGNDATMKP